MRFRPSAPKFNGGDKEPEVPATEPEPFREEAAELVDAVPGTVAGVREWVGDSTARAQRALEQERRSDKPRPTLIAWLHDVMKHNSHD